MQTPAQSKAEQRFAAAQKKADKALSEREKARQADASRTAKLKALRLAKEAEDAEKAAAAKTTAKPKKPAAKKST